MFKYMCNQLGGKVNERQCSDFEAKSCDIFLPDKSADARVEIKKLSPSTEDGHHSDAQASTLQAFRSVSTVQELVAALEAKASSISSRIIIISRLNSWSRMDITLEMFAKICAADKILPGFLKIGQGFTKKLSSKDEDFMACYSQISKLLMTSIAMDRGVPVYGQGAEISVLEAALCFNIRYFELHGRALDDPWSCRQSALHQRLIITPDAFSSSMILIQPPTTLRQDLAHEEFDNKAHPLQLVLKYIGAGLEGWRGYLNYISGKLTDLDLEVSICRPYKDFGLDLASKQRVHSLRQKIYYAQSIVLNTLDTCQKVREYAKKVASKTRLSTATQQVFNEELDNHLSELKNYLHTIAKLLSSSFETKTMYDDIFKSFQHELLHQNGMQLATIAQADSAETKFMASLANKTYQDSRTMRIATLIAMLYLPANLVLSFFSTTLVWFQDANVGDNSEEGTELRVHSQVWIAIVSSIILAAGTMLASWWWDRQGWKRVRHLSGIS